MSDSPVDAGLRDEYVRSLQRSASHGSRADRPQVFTLAGREWDLCDSVFPPVFSPSTGVLLDLLTFPVGGSLLEMGCGAGVVAVSAALAGCARVVATDVNPAAAANAERNARRHGVADRVRCLSGDLFTALGPDETFDMVFWHSNYVRGPVRMELSARDRGYVDAGYAAHRGYLAEAPRRVRPGGVALLGFSSRGDEHRLRSLAAGQGVELETIARTDNAENDTVIEYRLLALRTAGGA